MTLSRHLNRGPADEAAAGHEHVGLLLEHQHHRPSHRHDADRLVRRVEDERSLHPCPPVAMAEAVLQYNGGWSASWGASGIRTRNEEPPRPASTRPARRGARRTGRPGRSRPRGVGGRARALAERLEHAVAQLGRDPAAGVLDRQQDPVAPGRLCDPHPHRGVRRGVPGRVGQQVLDDPLHLAGVEGDGQRLGLDLGPAAVEQPSRRRSGRAATSVGRRLGATIPWVSRSRSSRSLRRRSSLRALATSRV